MKPWDAPLIRKGMTAQFSKRRARIAAGERPLGWKVGLGAPATMEKLGLERPLVGFLMEKAQLPSGATVSLKSYLKPVAEPEIAVRMGRDLDAHSRPDIVLSAIREIMPAIELADLDPLPAPDNLDAVLDGDIFQRQVLLGEDTRAGGSVEGLTSRVFRRGEEVNRTTEPEALTGRLLDIVAHVANVLTAFGEKLSAGDIVITGSITPPPFIGPDETEFIHALDPIGGVRVNFTWA
ncbi:MAG TPA: fumarylacetoacetate hydrolase family protein [Pseudolabrys sp.]|jgi:2-keto-4-pentenoate hydratase|nr:fumarylacetoacetate hydrolase family protein [Pseudolabrys sp.]